MGMCPGLLEGLSGNGSPESPPPALLCSQRDFSEPRQEKLEMAESIRGQGQRKGAKGRRAVRMTVDPSSEESDCGNTVRSKFIGGAAVESPPLP